MTLSQLSNFAKFGIQRNNIAVAISLTTWATVNSENWGGELAHSHPSRNSGMS
jgi:hypothetical protein